MHCAPRPDLETACSSQTLFSVQLGAPACFIAFAHGLKGTGLPGNILARTLSPFVATAIAIVHRRECIMDLNVAMLQLHHASAVVLKSVVIFCFQEL
eukprot:2888249-Pleurochrysis_carterae.AAC.11